MISTGRPVRRGPFIDERDRDSAHRARSASPRRTRKRTPRASTDHHRARVPRRLRGARPPGGASPRPRDAPGRECRRLAFVARVGRASRPLRARRRGLVARGGRSRRACRPRRPSRRSRVVVVARAPLGLARPAPGPRVGGVRRGARERRGRRGPRSRRPGPRRPRVAPRGDAPPMSRRVGRLHQGPESVRRAVEDASTPRCPHLVGRASTRRPHVLVSERRGGATAASLGLARAPLGGVVRRFVRCAECWEKLETSDSPPPSRAPSAARRFPSAKRARSRSRDPRIHLTHIRRGRVFPLRAAVGIRRRDRGRRRRPSRRSAARRGGPSRRRARPRRRRNPRPPAPRAPEPPRRVRSREEASAGGEKTRRSTAALADARRLFAEAAKEAGTAERLTREAISRRNPRHKKTERAGGAAAAYRPWELGYVAEAGESDAAEGGVGGSESRRRSRRF